MALTWSSLFMGSLFCGLLLGIPFIIAEKRKGQSTLKAAGLFLVLGFVLFLCFGVLGLIETWTR